MIFNPEKEDCKTPFHVMSAKHNLKLCSAVRQQPLTQLKPARPRRGTRTGCC